jgi:hypothetical protein
MSENTCSNDLTNKYTIPRINYLQEQINSISIGAGPTGPAGAIQFTDGAGKLLGDQSENYMINLNSYTNYGGNTGFTGYTGAMSVKNIYIGNTLDLYDTVNIIDWEGHAGTQGQALLKNTIGILWNTVSTTYNYNSIFNGTGPTGASSYNELLPYISKNIDTYFLPITYKITITGAANHTNNPSTGFINFYYKYDSSQNFSFAQIDFASITNIMGQNNAIYVLNGPATLYLGSSVPNSLSLEWTSTGTNNIFPTISLAFQSFTSPCKFL